MTRVAILLKTNEGGLWSIPHASELRNRGHEVFFVVPEGAGTLVTAAQDNGFKVHQTKFQFQYGHPGSTIRGMVELRNLWQELRPETIFYHLYASALAGRFSSLGLGIQRAHMVAGPVYLESRAIRVIESLLVGMDSVLIAGSEFTFRQYFNLPFGLARTRMRTIAYGVDTSTRLSATLASRAKSRLDLGIDPSAFVVVMVAYFYAPKKLLGHSVGLKGHEDLIAAWIRFHSAHPTSRLLVVGGGFGSDGERYRSSLINSTEECGIQWIDSVADVTTYYHAADISVSPSLSENHGAAMEASAYGVPSIVSDAGGLPEMVTESTGWIFPAGNSSDLLDALESAFLAHESADLQGMGSGARGYVETHYSHDVVVPKVANAVLAGLSRPRRLGIVTEARFNRSRVGEWVAADQVNGDGQWNKYRESGLEVMVLGRSSSETIVAASDDAVLCDTKFFPLKGYSGIGGFFRTAPRVLWSLCRGLNSCEVLLLRVPGPLSVMAGTLAQVLGIPYAVEVVGDIEGVLDRGFRRTFVRPVASSLTRFVVSGAAAARYVTEESLQVKYPARTPRVIGFSDVQLSDSDFVGEPREYLNDSNRLVLLSVGSQNNDYKGHQYAIGALPLLLKRFKDVELRLVGDGPFQQSLRDSAARLGVADKVVFLGQVERKAVISEMDSADLLLQPSRTEGLPRTIVEGMARGLPSVGSRVGGIPELLPSSLLFEVGDVSGLVECIERCVADPSVYSRQSGLALSRADGFRESVLSNKFKLWCEWLSGL